MRRKNNQCRKGHEMTPENTKYVPSTGYTQCRRCNWDGAKQRRELSKRRATVRHTALRSQDNDYGCNMI